MSGMTILWVVGIGTLFLAVSRVFYNVYLHPLRDYSGPKLWCASRLPWHYYNVQGRLAWKILQLHEKYGPTIRIAPDELSYTSARAWKKIYGQLKPEFPKCLDGRGIAPVSPFKHLRGLLAADYERHAKLRRAIAPAFTEKALREQESCLQHHSSKLITHLRREASKGPVDIVKWFNLATFDIISDLAFGQPEGCLDNADQPWVAVMGARAKSIPWLQFHVCYGIEHVVTWLAPKSPTKARQQHMVMTAAKVQRRLQGSGRTNDFMSYILDNKTERLTNSELVVMASAFLVAGSGTSARALSATIYYLVTNRESLAKVCHEVRAAFQSESDITIRTASQLLCLTACIDEAMRLHPPQPSTLPRFVPDSGEEIEGEWVPGGTAVGVHQLSSGHAPTNFTRPNEFISERWLSSTEFHDDDRTAVQPFSYGPRSCIGMNLAYAEMRLILAKLLMSFDPDLADESAAASWTQSQKSYLTWEQIPLMVKLRARE